MSDVNENGLLNTGANKPEKAHEMDATKKVAGLFFTNADKNFLQEIGQELVQGIVKQSFLLYRIDLKKTKTHKIYGEAKKKVWIEPVEIFGRINVEQDGPEYFSTGGLIRKGFGTMTAAVYLNHLDELNVSIRVGDYMYYKGNHYEITDDGSSGVSNQHAFASDRLYSLTIKGVQVNTDVFKAL